MGSIFEIKICHDDADYARSASVEAFRLLDILEQDLSRFIPNSDISRINHLKVGDSTVVSIETFECLHLCVKAYELTKGVFDVTIGELYNCWLNEDKSLRSPGKTKVRRAQEKVGMYHISLNSSTFSVEKHGADVKFDFGGFGKGYALDKMAELLFDWSLDSFYLNGGQSSILVSHAPEHESGWQITFSDSFQNYKKFKDMYISNIAVSGSGTQKGRHIIDPRKAVPIDNNRTAWAFTSSAAMADALSTAFMILSFDEMNEICSINDDIKAIILEDKNNNKNRITYIGNWEQSDVEKSKS